MPGRPRDRELEERLMGAAWSLLVAHGYNALTVSQVASEAAAHRSDVYRRWSTKAQLVVAALAEHLPRVSEVDTGALRSDLRAIVGDFAASWSSPWIDGLVGLAADLQQDPDAELAFRLMAEGRGGPLKRVLERAIARAEIEPLADLSLVGDLVEGTLMHRRIVGRQPLTPQYLDLVARSVEAVLTDPAVHR